MIVPQFYIFFIMGKRFLGLLNKFLAFLLALLGVQSCDPGADEYGCPSADYIFQGKVTDEAGNPLPDVRVSGLPAYEYSFDRKDLDSLSTTGADGTYSALVRSDCGVYDLKGLRFSAKDGTYVDTVWKQSDLAPFKHGRSWHKGLSENTLDITLKK